MKWSFFFIFKLRHNRKKSLKRDKKRMLQLNNLRRKQDIDVMGTLGQPAESSGSGVVLVQNKENRLAGRLGLISRTCQPTTQTLNGGQEAAWSGDTPEDSYCQNQVGQSAHCGQDHNVLKTSCTPAPSPTVKRGKAGAKAKLSSCTPLDKGSRKTHEYNPSNYHTQHGEELDFTSDDVSQLGATLYGQEPVRRTASPQPSPGANPAGPTAPASTGAPRNTDVSVMLRLIRRAMGPVAESRADSGATQPRAIKQVTSRVAASKRTRRRKRNGTPR